MNAQVELTRAAPAKATPATEATLALSPAQATALQRVEHLLAASPCVALIGATGSGRTTLLKQLAEKYQGKLISTRDFVHATASRAPDVSEAAIGSLIVRQLEHAHTVLVDDFDALQYFVTPQRPLYFMSVVLKHIVNAVSRSGKRLIISGRMPQPPESPTDIYGNAAALATIPAFEVEDYTAFAVNLLGAKKASQIDFKTVYRYASTLDGHQLSMACRLAAADSAPNAESVIDSLQRCGIVAANTQSDEVEAITFESLPGFEDIVAKLETYVTLPLDNRALAQRLGLKPKRGVLLYGPPGTGKTTVGRALAHRMKGKFFLIDGSFVTEPPAAFFHKLAQVVKAAKENSPSVLFIDDADVLFKIEHIAGLSRYLLSLLDGLESETASNVCVMMTAMDVRKIPEALRRSGRVELWLETKAPSEEVRGRILQRWTGTELPGHDSVDYAALAAATEGFTPADLRRLVGDAKALYAADQVHRRAIATATEYVQRAIDNIVAVRSRMANSLGDESLRVGADRKKGKYAKGAGGAAQMGTCAAPGW